MNNLVRKYVGLLLILLASASCDAGGGVGGTGISSSGTITGFGSVIVNGVEFNTTGATISVDDNPGSESDLAIGMVVTVRGTSHDDGTGSATSVSFDDNLEGPISSITPAAKTLVVLGQTVVWDDSTTFEPIDPSTLIAGNIIEVSGFASSGGVIQATRIEKKADLFIPGVTEVELKGTVSSHNSTTKTFSIGTQQVNYTNAVVDDNMPSSGSWDGLFVEVKGTLDALPGTLNATKIELEDEALEVQENQEVELEGLVTFFDPLDRTNFEVNGQPVQTSSSTVFENGSPDDLSLNVRLEVEGTLANGVLVAEKIEFRHTRVRIEASVDAVDPDANTVTFFCNPSNCTGSKVVVKVNALTEMEDETGDPLSLDNINVGNFLEIKAHVVMGTSGSITEIIATEVERDDLDEVLLQGPVSEASNPTLVILGVTVNTSGASLFEDINDNSITRDAFFSQLQTQLDVETQPLVKAKGTWTGAQINAEELEIED